MKRFALSALFLLLSGICIAQTTTTYSVTTPVSGTYGSPFRAFNIPLTNGAAVNWLEVGNNTACAGQTTPPVGFIFLTLPGGIAQPCIPLTGSPTDTVGTFAGIDSNGNAISGSYSFVITKAYKCSGGRTGGCHTVFTIQSGTVTVTE